GGHFCLTGCHRSSSCRAFLMASVVAGFKETKGKRKSSATPWARLMAYLIVVGLLSKDKAESKEKTFLQRMLKEERSAFSQAFIRLTKRAGATFDATRIPPSAPTA